MVKLSKAEINSIRFGIYHDSDIRIDSAVEIKSKDGYKGDLPAINGVVDSSMGTTDYNIKCNTCVQVNGKCPGHQGFIECNYPLIHPMYRDLVIKWLKIICFNCGQVLNHPLDLIKKNNIPFNDIVKKLSSKNSKENITCANCQEEHPHVKKLKKEDIKIFVEYFTSDLSHKNNEKQVLNNHISYIFNKISDDIVLTLCQDLEKHPRHLIKDVIPVLPNTCRSNVKEGSGKFEVDSITSSLRDIVKTNNNIAKPTALTTLQNYKDYIQPDSSIIRDYNNLALDNFAMMVGSAATNKRRVKTNVVNSQPASSIKQKFISKEGTIRGNIMGKRVANMARSVISGNPNLKLDEVGMPIESCSKLFVLEVVNDYNIARLNIYYLNGSTKYPGSNIIYHDGKPFKVDKYNKKFPLQIGDKLSRMLIDGDSINFNRPPTLLYSSISSMIVKVIRYDILKPIYDLSNQSSKTNVKELLMSSNGADNFNEINNDNFIKSDPIKTFTMNPETCVLYGADFDGDAMTIQVAATDETAVETRMLASVQIWSISHKNSNPTMGLFHDGIVGMFELTQSNIVMEKYHAMLMTGRVADHTYIYDKKTYTGRDIVQFALNKFDVNYSSKAGFYKENWNKFINYKEEDINVVIKRGKYVSGVLDSKSIGQGSRGSLLHNIYSKYGANALFQFIWELCQIADMFMSVQGFSFGLKDILLPKDAIQQLREITDNMLAESYDITSRLNAGKIIPPIGMTIEEQYEVEQQNAIIPGDEYNNIILKNIDHKNNHFFKLMISGAKGSLQHLRNMSACVGSQEINGKRIAKNFGYERTLPYFSRFDDNPISRGFIVKSFNDGLDVHEYIYNTMDGRYALINRALGTSETGTKNRETTKNLESIIIDYNRTCSTEYGIVELAYGDNAVDPRAVEEVIFPTIFMSDSEMKEKYLFTISQFDKEFKSLKTSINKKDIENIFNDEFTQMIADRDLYRSTYLLIENCHDGNYLLNNRKYVPCNIKRIIIDVCEEIGYEKLTDPVMAAQMVKEFCDDLPYVYYNCYQKQKQLKLLKMDKMKTTMVEIIIRSYLNIRTMIADKISIVALKLILEEIRTTYIKSLLDYGKSIGILTSQSICEPMTQYILDSHHRAGMAQLKKTSFLTRVRELFVASDKNVMENPSMTLYVKKEYEKNKQMVHKIATHIELVKLYNFLDGQSLIFFEKFGEPVHPDYLHEKKMIDEYIKHNPSIKVPVNLSKWCIRYELNKFVMLTKNMDLLTIILKIKENKHLFVIHNQEINEKIVIRIYVKNTFGKKGVLDIESIKRLDEYLKDELIRGVKHINRAFVMEVPRTKFADDNGISPEKDLIYVIKTAGINFEELLFNPYLDTYNMHCDSVIDTQQIYGVQAGRNKLINEVRLSIPDINVSNYMLLADEIMRLGYSSKINHFGLVERYPDNILLQLSDSHQAQVLQNAAYANKKQNINGISSSLMVGSVPKYGSMYPKILINEQMIKENVISLDDVIDDLIN